MKRHGIRFTAGFVVNGNKPYDIRVDGNYERRLTGLVLANFAQRRVVVVCDVFDRKQRQMHFVDGIQNPGQGRLVG